MTAQQHSTSATATPPSSPLTRVLDFYRQCLDNGTWARCVLECKNGVETISFRCKAGGVEEHSTVAVSNVTKKHVRPSRRRRNRRRRMAWLDKRAQLAKSSCPDPPSGPSRAADSPPLRAPVPASVPTPPVAVRTRAQKRRKLASSPESPERERVLLLIGTCTW